MSESERSRWLREVRQDWEVPEELLTPATAIESNLAIRILSCDVVGHEVRVLLGHFIAEQSLFTIWFLQEVKNTSVDSEEAILMTGFGDEQTMLVYDAWKKLESAIGADAFAGQRVQVLAGAAGLVNALEEAVRKLVGIRSLE
jgi:hypothetical protein